MPHCEYSEYPTAGFPVQPQPPPTVKAADLTSAPPPAAGALNVPLVSTQSTPWENVEHPTVSTKSTPLQVRRRRRRSRR